MAVHGCPGSGGPNYQRLRPEIIRATSRGHVCLHPARRLTSGLATAVICGLLVTGCAPQPGSSHATPVSPQAYQTELRTEGDALRAALDGIRAAPPGEPLARQVESAAAVVRAAAQRLATTAAPAQYVTAQADLVAAFAQLASQLSDLGAQVQSRQLCTAPSVVATLSTLPGVDALRRAASALGPAGAGLSAAAPAPEPLPDRRRSNGTVLRAPGSGEGEITAENGTDHDAVITISQDGSVVGSFYVAHGETARMANIPDGTYDIFYASGADWDGGQFTRSCVFWRFDKTAAFTTTKTQSGIQYVKFSITLRPVPNGNTQLVDVPPESFPK